MGWINRVLGGSRQAVPSEAAGSAHVSGHAAPDFVVIDVETSCSRKSSICQVGIVGFTAGLVSFEYETLVDPCDEFHPFNVELHGIDRHHVRGKPKFRTLHSTIAQHLGGRITVAHSAFDRGALAAACSQHSKPVIETRWLDSVKVARRAWPELASHRLNVLASHLGLELQHHDALSDARAAGMVIVKAIDHTGIALGDWFGKLEGRPKGVGGSIKRMGADVGTLAGECITFTGDLTVPRGEMADLIAAAGGAVSPSPNRRTTMLVLGAQDPSTFAGKSKSSKHLKAEELIAAGQAIAIVTEAELRQRLANFEVA